RQPSTIPILTIYWTSPVIDGAALQRALINLIDNAIKFSPTKTHVSIALEPHADNDAFQIGVHDQGSGILQGEQDKIFDRFYRCGSELRRETQGAGVGLSIVRHIVDAHGGSISVENKPGQGTSFILTIPSWRDC
ncbi:MAG: sensor histidine kinase, partial [Verrucomicrobiales bacterium]